MPRPVNVLFLMEDLCFGGTQKQNLELACRLDRSIFKTRVLTLTGPTDLDVRLHDAGITLDHMGKSRKAAPFFFFRLKAWLRRIRPDILVPCTALPNIWGRIWGKLEHVPVIVGTCRGGGAPMRQHERFLWRLASHIVCNSQALVTAMRNRHVPAAHLSYIPNGVDTEHFKPASHSAWPPAPLIACVARLARDKDHQTLLRAFELVCRQHSLARLRIVGEGPEEEKLKLFASRNLSPEAMGRIEFAGPCADALPHYQDAQIFALSSIREGQPNVIMEAMSCGLPVCATAIGGIPGLVSDNVHGRLSAAGDAEAMAGNLLALLADPGQCRKMGMAARHRMIADYSFETMVGAHQKLFLDLLKKTAAG